MYVCHTNQIGSTINSQSNFLLRSTKENAFIVRSDFENFGPFIDTDLAPPKNSSGANDVIAIYHVLQPRSQGLSSCGKM